MAKIETSLVGLAHEAMMSKILSSVEQGVMDKLTKDFQASIRPLVKQSVIDLSESCIKNHVDVSSMVENYVIWVKENEGELRKLSEI